LATAGEHSAKHHDCDELFSVVAPSGPTIGKIPKASFRQKLSRKPVVGPTHSRNFVDKFCFQDSPLGSSPPSPSELDQSLHHRRNNRHHKTGSQGGKENDPPLLCQPGKTLAAKAGRLVLADVTLPQGRSESFDYIPFAGSTSVQSPLRKVDNGEPGSAGLKFELDQRKPSLANFDSQETITAHDSFVPIDIESVDRPSGYRESSPSTPLREALASFNNMFSSTFITPSKKSRTANDPPNTFRMSFRLPASPLPTGVALSDAFSLSTLADSISQLTGDIAASFTAHYENDHLCQGQYHDDAVARDEKFHWEEEMKCLENQCGLYGETN